VERALDVCEKVATAMNNDAAWRSRLLDPVQVWGVEGLTSTEAVVRLVVRAQPGADAPEAARELRFRIVRDLAAAQVRTSAQREISIRPVQSATPPAVGSDAPMSSDASALSSDAPADPPPVDPS